MKYIAYTIIFLAFILGIYNATKLNIDGIFEDESLVALITILASLCAIFLMLILLTSKKIEALSKKPKRIKEQL